MTTTPAREAIRDEALKDHLLSLRAMRDAAVPGNGFREALDFAIDALANAVAVAVPEGFVLVPRVPTQEMFEAFNSCPDPSFAAAYRAMLSAAPSSDTGGVG